jgi:hypothetical protein
VQTPTQFSIHIRSDRDKQQGAHYFKSPVDKDVSNAILNDTPYKVLTSETIFQSANIGIGGSLSPSSLHYMYPIMVEQCIPHLSMQGLVDLPPVPGIITEREKDSAESELNIKKTIKSILEWRGKIIRETIKEVSLQMMEQMQHIHEKKNKLPILSSLTSHCLTL